MTEEGAIKIANEYLKGGTTRQYECVAARLESEDWVTNLRERPPDGAIIDGDIVVFVNGRTGQAETLSERHSRRSQ